MSTNYYESYEKRYQAINEAKIDVWGNSEKDPILFETLRRWVEENSLKGKKVIEFACGEGSCALILSELGVDYTGVDIAQTAINEAEKRLTGRKNVRFRRIDIVKEKITENFGEKFDAALDVMGIHMIVTDGERQSYLKNAFDCLNNGAPMLLFRENYNEEAKETVIDTFEDFKKMTGADYETPQKREMDGKEVYIPLLPSRARSKAGYVGELEEAGFVVEKFVRSEENRAMLSSADIYVRKN